MSLSGDAKSLIEVVRACDAVFLVYALIDPLLCDLSLCLCVVFSLILSITFFIFTLDSFSSLL